jgi:hypothetical protein
MKQLKQTRLTFSTQTLRTLAQPVTSDQLRAVVGGGIPTKIVSMCALSTECGW